MKKLGKPFLGFLFLYNFGHIIRKRKSPLISLVNMKEKSKENLRKIR